MPPCPRPVTLRRFITGTDQNGKNFKLADQIGKKIVLLYFYPKDFTGGCTKEACSFRDGFENSPRTTSKLSASVLIPPTAIWQFIAKYKLNFTLLADTDGKIVRTFTACGWHGKRRQSTWPSA